MHLVIWLGLMAVIYGFRMSPLIFNFLFQWFCKGFIAGFVTPTGHRKYGSYSDSKAYLELSGEGYNVEPWFALDAVAKIERSR